MTFEPTSFSAVAGLEQTVKFTVKNLSPETAARAKVQFEATDRSSIAGTRLDDKECTRNICYIGNLEGYESVSGRAILRPGLGFQTQINLRNL